MSSYGRLRRTIITFPAILSAIVRPFITWGGHMAASKMSAAHKAALAEGRNDARAVKAYLDFLTANRPKRGRKRTVESVKKRLAAIEDAIEDAPTLQALQMAQERIDLERELQDLETPRAAAGVESE